MNKLFYIALLSFTMMACNSKDAKFCECMEVSEAFNKVAAKAIEGELSSKELKEMSELKTKKATACKDYQTMDGKLMLEKKEACN
jgi:hypothetical protein